MSGANAATHYFFLFFLFGAFFAFLPTGGARRADALLRGTHPEQTGRYGMGTARSLDDFWRRIGVDQAPAGRVATHGARTAGRGASAGYFM